MNNGYYSYDKIDKTEAQYRMVIGERSNGKTYGALLKVLREYISTGKQGAYIRRYREDFVGKRGQALFASLEGNVIQELSNNEWNSVTYYSGAWYLSYNDYQQKPIKDTKPFCYGFSLNQMEHDKSTSYPNITTIIFDEFITRNIYLNNEFVLFMNVVSTIVRQRKDVIIYMLGNTVNKYCPYFNEMGITRVKEMEQGDLDVYNYGNSNLKVAVEYTPMMDETVKESKDYFAFDNPALNMITDGSWEVDMYPHMTFKTRPKDIKLIYFIKFDDELLQCEIIKYDNNLITFIHRKTTEIKGKKDIVFSNEYNPSIYYHRRITIPSDEKTRLIWELLKNEKVYFQDNSVGEIISNYLKWCRKTEIFRKG